ncbi:MAG TPA: mechanosensitive ion channel domain-containing protein [Patescibacteria group bacterium]|nr:mechanosensitive ion channel domain-containing protein [Patescibacteria group bacterium]
MAIEFEIGLLYQALTVVLVLVVTYVFGWVVSNILRRTFKRAGFAETEMVTVGSIVKYSIYFAGVLIALNYLGIPVAYFLIALALVAAVLGFSARSALDNILSGYSLRLYGPFTVGDVIEVDGRTGRVKDMTPLKTMIETADRLTYSVPNSRIMQLDVYNFSRYKSDYPVELEFEVSRAGDLEAIKLELLEIVSSYPRLSLNKPVRIHIERFGGAGLMLKVVFFVPSFEIVRGARDFVAGEILEKSAAGKISLLDSCAHDGKT